MGVGRPKYGALMRAYDALENARANFELADMGRDAKSVNSRQVELRDAIISLMEAQEPEEIVEAAYEVNPSNPSMSAHQKNGSQFLNRSEMAWDRFYKKQRSGDLIDSFQFLVLAERELGYAKDRSGIKQAKEGIKAARAELTGRLKKKTAKKPSKKKAAKKK
jgi:hypothetical protein